jgi:type IV pilus assembly protein PilZ
VAPSSILTIDIPDANALRRIYMPFLEGGGLFIPGLQGYVLGNEVFLLVRLPDSDANYPVHARIAWFTPATPGRERQQGFGFQLCDRQHKLKREIEKLIAGDDPAGVNSLTL